MIEPTTSNLWLMLEVLARRRRFVIGFVLAVTLVSIGIALVLPKWYRAEALLLPPKDIGPAVDQLSRLSEVVSVTGGLNLPVMVTPSDVYARMLRSRSISDRIISAFDLQHRYQTQTHFETYEALMDHARFRVTEEGLLSITVEDKDPQTAADMANAFVDEINKLSQEITSSRARESRSFLEERLSQVRMELDSARTALERFQQTYKTVDFDEQTRLAIEQASGLKVSLAQIDLDLQMSSKKLGTDNPNLMELRQKRDIVKRQLSQLELGGSDSSYFSLPVSAIPGLKGQYEMLYSRVRVGESLYNILLGQLEQAKIEEKRQSPTITVLDRANVPELRYRPKRSLIVLGSVGGSFLIALLLAVLFEYFDRMREQRPDDYRRAAYVINSLLGWFPGIRRRVP
ncbi:MAG: Wzz/FepE/Etk N-terminal domain-containing protein [Candidatus Zixiibacteriota bacterium]